MSHAFSQIDKNQPIIVKALRDIGAEVQSLATIGNGCADILVGYKGKWYVAEIKNGKGKLNDKEIAWHDRFNKQAPVLIWRTPEEAIKAITERESD